MWNECDNICRFGPYPNARGARGAPPTRSPHSIGVPVPRTARSETALVGTRHEAEVPGVASLD